MGCAGTKSPVEEWSPQWWPANSPESEQWIKKNTGFGLAKKFSYRDAVITNSETNREGNRNGELGGKIVFYERADKGTNYAYLPDNQTIDLADCQRLYAKAFLKIPLGRIPVGENFLEPQDDLKGSGRVLLACKPRIIAIYVSIDGKAQTQEHFCEACARQAAQESKNAEIPPTKITKAKPGSFFTYIVSESQDPYFFLHFPLIGKLGDTKLNTGNYGETLLYHFTKLMTSLTPGTHKVKFQIHFWYDHREFEYYIEDVGSNPRGRWRHNLQHDKLHMPYPDPSEYVGSEEPFAEGSCTVDVPNDYKGFLKELQDRKPPIEKYTAEKAEQIKADAKIVAGGKFCAEFPELSGLPDFVILTSEPKEEKHVDMEAGIIEHYVHVDIAALWLNETDTSPNEMGAIVECRLAKGVIGDKATTGWVCLPIVKDGKCEAIQKKDIKNKYIQKLINDSK